MSNVLANGTSALLAFQRAMSTVSHNVANVGTEGYSRQRVELEARAGSNYGYGYQGGGVQIVDVRRMADSLATSRLLDAGSELSRLQQLSTLSDRVDSLFSDKATGISAPWSGFFDAVSSLSSNAASTADRQNVLAQAKALASRFNQVDAQLDRLGDEVNSGLKASVAEVNRLTKEIAQLNAAIGSNVSRASGDLLDRRDRLIGELVGYTGGTAVQQDGGHINVFTAGGQPLVVGAAASQLATVSDPFQPERLQVALQTSSNSVTLSDATLGGKMGGLLEFRSTVLDPALAELGRVAVSLAQTFNEGHAAGMDQYGQMGAAFFSIDGPRVTAHPSNGDAVLDPAVGSLAALKGQSVLLRFDGSQWLASDPITGAALTVSGDGTTGNPLVVNGVELLLASGTPQANDRFLLQPTAGAAGTLKVAITDPSRIAAASPLVAAADVANTGSGIVAGLSVLDPADPGLHTATDIVFIDAGQYTVGGAGPFAYTPGQTISHNGWSLTLDGAPQAGDLFQVRAGAAGSSDNGNATRLANLDDARVLDGGTMTLNGAIGGLTTTVGSAARQAEYSAQAQQVIHDQALAARDSIAGVNLDEEAADLIRLQQAYQAASQIISTADNMFQSLLRAVAR